MPGATTAREDSVSRAAGLDRRKMTTEGQRVAVGDRPSELRLTFGRPDDRDHFSDLMCLVREQIEVFVDPPKPTTKKKGRGKERKKEGVGGKKDVVGDTVPVDLCAAERVGIRCVHCRGRGRVDGSTRGAAVYPTSTRLLYQAVRNYQRYHMLGCPAVPPDLRGRLVDIKNATWQRRSSNKTGANWEVDCARLGLVDADDGELRFLDSVLDGTWTAEMGRQAAAERVEEVATRKAKPRGKAKGKHALDVEAKVDSSFNGDEQQLPVNLQGSNKEGNAGTSFSGMVPAPVVSAAAPGTLAFQSSPVDNFSLHQALETFAVGTNSVGGNTSPGVTIPGAHGNTYPGTLHYNHAPSPQTSQNLASIPTALQGYNSGFPVAAPALQQEISATSRSRDHANDSLINPSGNVCVPPPTDFGGEPFPTQAPAAFLFENLSVGEGPSTATSAVVGGNVPERVELARCLVQTAAEIRRIPVDTTAGPTPSGDEGVGSEELRFLGAELYELFSDRRPFLNGLGTESSGEATTGQQRTKRGRAPERGEGGAFVPLSELGLPSALCCLVSSLLETKRGSPKEHDGYASLEEIQEDLQLMVNNPKKFLVETSGVFGLLDLHHDALYGRDKEVSQLLEAFNRIIAPVRTDSKSSMVLISGYSGTGKSSLVRKVQCEYVQRGARFISGKFDYMQQILPLSAIMNALNEYCDLLAQDTNHIDEIRLGVTAAVGWEGQKILVNRIPNLRKILGGVTDGSPPIEVTGREAQQRLESLVRLLLRSTCSGDRPVVLFLDDLQWADASSLDLMRSLVTDPMLDTLLFIGCCRDNEVGPGHLLLECLDSIQRSGNTAMSRISTSNLDMASVTALVSDALHMLPRATRSLSEAVLQKTSGNALFVEQFLASLNDEGLLRYSLTTRKWEWDIESIRAKNIANNAVDLMTAKLLRLAPEVHEALKVAAAFGSQCLKDVLRIFDKDPGRLGSTMAALDVAVAEGLMAEVEGPAYRFSHDQLQNAAYMLIAESEREAFHLGIGRSLWQQSSVGEIDSYIFVLVDQLHRGAGLISDRNEKIRLAQLSLTAGQRAAAMSAYLPASAYLESGIGLTVEDDWQCSRQLCFDLHNLCAEMEYILGNFDEVKVHIDEVIRRGRTLQEKLRAYYTSVQSSGSQGDINCAFATAITVLGDLGESIPSEMALLQVQQELLATQAALSTKTETELLALNTMENSDKREAMKFFNLLIPYAYAERPNYFPIVSCRMLTLSLSYGVCRESAIGFGMYGLLLCGLVGNTAGGYRMGKVALSLLNRFNAKECLPRVFIAVYGFINDWTEPMQSSVPSLKQGADVGMSIGDNEFAMVNATYYQGSSLASGKPLGKLMDEISHYATQMIELKQNWLHTMNQPIRQFTLNLLGKSSDPVKLVGEMMDEGALLQLAEKKSSSTLRSLIYFYRMWLEVLFGEYERAVETAAKNQTIGKDSMGRFATVGNHAFYYGLAALVLARKQGRSKWEGTINTTMAQMKRWASSNPWNCQHKLELMNAEYAYLEGDIFAATQAYDCAVATAKTHRFVHEEALALERAGIFYMENGDHTTASGLFERAHRCYIQWEAHSKAAHVKRYL